MLDIRDYDARGLRTFLGDVLTPEGEASLFYKEALERTPKEGLYRGFMDIMHFIGASDVQVLALGIDNELFASRQKISPSVNVRALSLGVRDELVAFKVQDRFGFLVWNEGTIPDVETALDLIG